MGGYGLMLVILVATCTSKAQKYDIQILDFDFFPLRPSEKVEPDEEFPVKIDVVLRNDSPFDLQPSQPLQLRYIFRSLSSGLTKIINVKSLTPELLYPFHNGIKSKDKLSLNDVKAEIVVLEEMCDGNEKQELCAHISTTDTSAVVLVSGDTSWRCIPFHLECVNHGMTYPLLQIGLLVGLSIAGSVVLIIVCVKLRKRYKSRDSEPGTSRSVKQSEVSSTTSGSIYVIQKLRNPRSVQLSEDSGTTSVIPELVSEVNQGGSGAYETLSGDEEEDPQRLPVILPRLEPCLSHDNLSPLVHPDPEELHVYEIEAPDPDETQPTEEDDTQHEEPIAEETRRTEENNTKHDYSSVSDDELTVDNEPFLEVKNKHLPSNTTREDVSFMRYYDSYNRPRISSDQTLFCMVKSGIRDKQSSDVLFLSSVKWIIPMDSTSNLDLQILYSATGTPESWEPIYGEYADYAQSASVNMSGSKLTFTTRQVGLFAIVKLKEILRRHLLVFLRPIDIELHNHVFLQMFAVKKSNIKEVKNQQLRESAYLCSNPEVTFEFKSTRMSGLKVEIDDVLPINHWEEIYIPDDISYKNLCTGDAQSQVEVKFTKYERHSICSSICGKIKVKHGDNIGKTSFDSQRIQREIVLMERGSQHVHDQSISQGGHHVHMKSNMQHRTQPISYNHPHYNPYESQHVHDQSISPGGHHVHMESNMQHLAQPLSYNSPRVIRSNMHPHSTCTSCATGNPHHPYDSDHINVPAHHHERHSPYGIRPMEHMRRRSHGVHNHNHAMNEDVLDYQQDPTVEAIEQEVVPDETGSYSKHHVKPATRNIISPKSYDMTGKIKGRAFILNNSKFDMETQLTQRHGSDVDYRNAIHVFEGIGYQVNGATNKTAEQISVLIKEFAASFGQPKYKSSVVFLMSHGNHKGICGTDGKLFLISDLHKIFDTNNCPQLKGKPKLFFIQACRTEPGVVNTEDAGQQTELQHENEEVIADNNSAVIMADMYTSFPTVHGFVSLRHEVTGSWFVQAVVEVFLARSHENSLSELMTMVRNRVLKQKGRMKNPATQQMESVRSLPEDVSRLTKTFHFLPVGSDNTNSETS